MQKAPSPQKAGRDGARRMLRDASFLALVMSHEAPLHAAEPADMGPADTEPGPEPGAGPNTGPSEVPPARPKEWREAVLEEPDAGGFIPAAAEAGPPPAPPAPPPVGARNSEAPPGEAAGGGFGFLATPRVGELLAAPGEQRLATMAPPAFVPLDGAATPAPGAAGPPPDPPRIVHGESGDGMIATLTLTRRVAPPWLAEAVADDPSSLGFIASTAAELPAGGLMRQVPIAWADLDGDGTRDGHLYRIDNAHDLAVTVRVHTAEGTPLPGSATVAAGSSAYVWLPLAGAAVVRFTGTDAGGDAIAWTDATGTQKAADMKTTTVTRAAHAGEVHVASSGADVFHFAPGDGVDAILGYDPGQDSVVLPAGTAAAVVDIGGTAALLIGPTGREGIVLDGIAYTPSLTLAGLNLLFA